MKHILTLVLALMMVLPLAACGIEGGGSEEASSADVTIREDTNIRQETLDDSPEGDGSEEPDRGGAAEPETPDESNQPKTEDQQQDSTQEDTEKKSEIKKDNTKQNDTKQDNTQNDTPKKEEPKKDDTAKEPTASEVLASMKNSLGGSYTSDTAESEDRISGYYGLDLSQIDSWTAESNSMSSMNMDCAVILKVKDGYAQDAAACLQRAFNQTVDYARMYDMDLQRVLQGRLYISGSYVALFIQGQAPDHTASLEDQAKFAANEAAKVDRAWSTMFGSAANSITIPEESGESFDMSGGMAG